MSLWSSKKDKFILYNSLACLLKAVEGKYTTVDLRNEAFVCGKIDEVDGVMNVLMSNVLFSDPSGKCFNYEKFFVQGRNIRYVHIPREVQIMPAINVELMKAFPRSRIEKRTTKQKRLIQQQQETMKLVAQFHKNRDAQSQSEGKEGK